MTNDEIMQEFGVTEAKLDADAREYEDGTWSGDSGNVVMGRPRLYDEDMETVSFRLPISRIRAIDSVTKRTGQKKSEFFRDAIDAALLAAQ